MMTFEALRRHVAGLLGSDNVWTDDVRLAAHAIDRRQPKLVVQPETTAQAADIIALAGRERFAVVPWGQGTQMHLGQTPARYDLALSLAKLTRVVDYDVANFTLIAEAGMPLCEVYRLTTPYRQFLPLGYAGTTASLGGLLVTNTSGVKRWRYGGVRDLVLGVRVALPDGALVHFGGRVVKNVAGYDMNKLFIGSLGTFGVVLETTYRLVALPEDDGVLAVLFPSLAQATAAAVALRTAPLLPSALLLLHADVVHAWHAALPWTVQPSQVVLLLNCDGSREAVARQLRDSRALCQTHGGLADTTLAGTTLPTLWALREGWCHAASATAQPWLHVRLGIVPTHLEATLTHLAQTPTFCQQPIGWVADAGHGQIWARLALQPSLSDELGQAVQDWLYTLRTQLRAHHGYAVVEEAPTTLRQQLDVWGNPPGAQLLSLYKQHFDPYAVLNPGRYVAGL
ncbi:MAG TPA: FAD-binding oxidoreductase [Candidatus Saccharimonadia bacterium]|nr:FAD-binding oxidoreductase [Candidatus Saccharimonadia bacterium]